MAYRLTKSATQDLLQIRHYTLEHWGEAQSHQYLSNLEQCFTLLSEQSGMGKKLPDLNNEALNFQHNQHVIYYRLHQGDIIIFAVLHQRMLPSLHLNNR